MPQSLAPHCSGADIAVLRPSTLMASGPKGEDAQHGAREIHASRIALRRMRIDAKQCAEQRGKGQLERKRLQVEAKRRREAAERCQSHKSLKGTGKKDSDAREKRGETSFREIAAMEETCSLYGKEALHLKESLKETT